ncbi:DUF3280 domain-containing protein [Tropicibacter sp. S64]|uniref:DUF3280 domain-containing protein n=1 Tax=Tropicibacter sp. S64 TaxID=3415122 RepID=UPI003C7D6C98
MRSLIIALYLMCATPLAAQGTVAFFGLYLLDTSLQTQAKGEHDAEDARIALLEDMVRERFAAEGYTLLDLAPIAADLDRVVNPAKCYGCDVRMAQKLGADFVLVGEVQKVSNLILSLNLQMRAVSDGEMVKGAVVDMRGNTDESWTRAMRYILKNRFFAREEK